jgi:hypothetical protein
MRQLEDTAAPSEGTLRQGTGYDRIHDTDGSIPDVNQ